MVNLEIRVNTIAIPLIPKWQRAFAPYVKQKRIGIWICAAADPIQPKCGDLDLLQYF